MKDCMFKLILQGSCKMPVMWKAVVAIARLANCLCSAYITPVVDSYAVAMQPLQNKFPQIPSQCSSYNPKGKDVAFHWPFLLFSVFSNITASSLIVCSRFLFSS